MTGSSFPCRASSVRSRPKLSSARGLGSCSSAAAPSLPLPPLPPRSASAPPVAAHAVTEQVEHLLADFLELQARGSSEPGRPRLLAHATGRAECVRCPRSCGSRLRASSIAVLDDLLGARRLRQLAHRDHVGSGSTDLLDLRCESFGGRRPGFFRTFAATPLPSLIQAERGRASCRRYFVALKPATALLVRKLASPCGHDR